MLSEVFLLLVDWHIVRTDFSLHWRWPNTSITPFRPDHEFSLTEVPPVGHTLVSAALPLIFGEDAILLHHPLGFELIHFPAVVGCLQLDDLVLLVLDLLKDLLAGLLVLGLKGVRRQWILSVLHTLLTFAVPLKLGSALSLILLLSGFLHDSEVHLALFLIHECFVGLLYYLEGVLGSGVLQLIGVYQHRQR